MENLDYLISESTYGGIVHNSLPQDYESLLNIIKETCLNKKGKLIIPAFSVGRTQEIVYSLDRLETEGRLPDIPVFVDSPLAVNATEIFQMHPDCFDSETREYMLIDPNPFGFNKLKYIRSVNESKKLNHLNQPAIIISASGMITGGRILHHVYNNIDNKKHTLLFVGYCAPNTLGAKIRNGDKTINIFGKKKNVEADIMTMDSYSAHADEPEIIEYLDALDRKKLKETFLVHGQIDRQNKLTESLLNQGFQKVSIPEINNEVAL